MSLYRSAAWLAKGLREYTKSGYESAAQHFASDDLDVQVSGRVFLVTGANSGLGKATAVEIAKRGGTVHLVCRDPARSEAAKSDIIRESGNQNIFLHIVDLSDPKKIWKFAETFKQEHKLHVLINNAGCMINKRELTEDGLEKNFATNTLGVYILTTALIPVLEKEQDPRVVTVSSAGMLVQKLSCRDLQWARAAFDGAMVYAQNKRQQVVMTEQWARLHPAVHFSSMHPGWADTPVTQGQAGAVSTAREWTRVSARLRGRPWCIWAGSGQRNTCGKQDTALGPAPTLGSGFKFGHTRRCSGLPPGSALRPLWHCHHLSVRQAMPGFHARFKDRLRTAAQGADTVLWLALATAASRQPSGLFFQDRKPVPKHLPLARTSSSRAEEEELMGTLEEMAQRFK